MKQPIRVLIVLGSSGLGGAENMVINYYLAMDRKKVQCDFLFHVKAKGSRDQLIRSCGGKVFYVPTIKPKNYFKYKRSLKEFFKKNRYHIVHSHINAYGYWALKEARKNNASVRIAHSHTSIEPFFKKIFLKNIQWSSTFKELIQDLLKHLLRKQATHYFACGHKAGKWLFGEKNSNKVTIIQNAIDSSLFIYDSEQSKEVKKKFPLGKKVIGHVGNFTEAKNHRFLVHVFRKMLNENPNLVLALVGEGNLQNEIEDEVLKLEMEDKVFFLGLRGDVNQLLIGFDLFLFPSLYEGLPVSLIEAQASGLKILASENITKEVAITDLIEFLNLNHGEEVWAKTALDSLEYQRRNMSNEIKTAGYDILENAKMLQKFYIDNYMTYVRN
ncbi:MAG: glycosyltransferase family 1 protein [Bacteroidota bacterium]